MKKEKLKRPTPTERIHNLEFRASKTENEVTRLTELDAYYRRKFSRLMGAKTYRYGREEDATLEWEEIFFELGQITDQLNWREFRERVTRNQERTWEQLAAIKKHIKLDLPVRDEVGVPRLESLL